ncbi:zinc finger CCCH domain-containing protein 53-like [Vicia villosa]|uniref:zinc finger CCCH domain-containing protein 53-like n=1 Tax=Vicia villosa TaxID=3911 RepID=UPI00273C884B|nr:zinc finger CCCH domain-containing protein 53-like [Vicia villosa]
MAYYDKYKKALQEEGYLAESQRHGKSGCNLTRLLILLRNSIRLIDRPRGQHAVVLAEDAAKFMGKADCQNISASQQIYLTFPADSTFSEDNVSNYFRYVFVQESEKRKTAILKSEANRKLVPPLRNRRGQQQPHRCQRPPPTESHHSTATAPASLTTLLPIQATVTQLPMPPLPFGSKFINFPCDSDIEKRDTFSSPPCTLVQPSMQVVSGDAFDVPEFAKSFCPPIYPLGEQQ